MNLVFSQVQDRCQKARSRLGERQWYQYTAEQFAKYGVATCGGMAIVAGFILKNDNQTPLHLSIVPEGNHEVLIIGEGDSAVICDPWMNCYYPQDRSNLYLREVANLNTSNPIVRKTEKPLQAVFKIQ